MRALATDSSAETPSLLFAGDGHGADDLKEPRDRRRLAGVGMPEGSFPCTVAERSRTAAIGVVNGRKWA